MLDARQSRDPQGRALTYRWAVVTQPAGADLGPWMNDSAQVLVVSNVVGAYVVSVTVSNGQASATATHAFNVTPDIRSIANTANAIGHLDLKTNVVALTWKDVAPKGTVYRIESRNADGSATLVATVPGLEGLGVDMKWERPFGAAVRYRIMASYQGSVQNLAGIDEAWFIFDTTGMSLQIGLDQAEPVAGQVALSLPDRPGNPYPWVTWYADGRVLRTGPVDQGASWSAQAAGNGAHDVAVRVEAYGKSFVTITRTVQVSSAAIAMTATASGGQTSPPKPPTEIVVSAVSDSGIVSVTGTIDGSNLGPPQIAGNGVYRFALATGAYSYGTHTAVLTATNGAGASRQITLTLGMLNEPVLVLASPENGAIVGGPVTIAGTSNTDGPKPLTTTVKVRDVAFAEQTVLATTANEFSAVYDFGGKPGTYQIITTATDAAGGVKTITRSVTYSPSGAARTQKLDVQLDGLLSSLLAANGSDIVYTRAEPGVTTLRFRSAVGEVVWGADGQALYELPATLVLGGGSAFAAPRLRADTSRNAIVKWSANGNLRSLSAESPFRNPDVVNGSATAVRDLAVSYPWIVWTEYQPVNDGTHIVVFNDQTGVFRKLTPAASIAGGPKPFVVGGACASSTRADAICTNGAPTPTCRHGSTLTHRSSGSPMRTASSIARGSLWDRP